ncbi:4-oxalocrotonate tautomerase [Methanococcus vannielii SB]|jgi:4-oxalocrotonate tautomerase|uniref:4-oxalocrotonate tautomerase n=1 Tax=Methanococcus vannielii (strain ATCC 35089 / DSM 1224 / JCM 13029 / OCM 148 / SB) TaxID=406327 RepID=A6UN52_METVS|nr:4-oxalocrotonate tautomerase DmpI [Methanococcus vannielii]ABR53924.1 4-oxalocrotonate tautomerase [Methanococcus vannielii SB]
MPVITIDVGLVSNEQKEELIKEFTKKASEIIGLSEEKFVVFIREHGYENIGVGGVSLSISLKK